jgi:predicted nicotinamide N-methyase
MNADIPPARAMPVTPEEALGPSVREQVFVDGQTFLVERPGNSDTLFDHPLVRAAFAADQYLPYWADLWPAARMLAKVIVRENWPPGLEALEIGCGLGLPGVAALSRGLRVTFSDYDATALRYAAANAALNGFDNFATLQMDWNHPPEGVQFPLLLASDLIYEMRNVPPLVALVKRLLRPGGECLVTDQDRVPSHVLRDTLAAEGLPFTTQTLRAGEPGGRRMKGTLYRIRLSPPAA